MSKVTPSSTRQYESLFPILPPTTSLEIIDLRAATFACRLSVASLVGLVNRSSARLYILETGDDAFWLQEIDPALPRKNLPLAEDDLLIDLLRLYREQVQGLIIYDPGLTATINVATTLAGLRSGLIVSPVQAEQLASRVDALPVLVDLRTYGWRTPLQAYAWAYRQLLPACSQRLIAGLNPGIPGSLRTFLIAHRVFTCWLDARNPLPAPSLGWLSERGLLKLLLARYAPGSLHIGWFINEPLGVRLTSRAAVFTLATDYSTNLEIWSNLSVPYPAPEPAVSESEETPEILQPSVLPAECQVQTTYLAFTFSEGDNLQYCQHRLLRLWNDAARGRLPLGWTIAPGLHRALPTLAAFYARTASHNDEFIAGPSGAGYVYPSYWPREHRQLLLNLTGEYLEEMHLSLLQVLDTNTLFSMKFLRPTLQTLFVERLRAYGLKGILSGWGGSCPSWRTRAGILVYQNLGMALTRQRALRLVQNAARRGIRFIHIYIYAWNITPSDLQTIVRELGDGFTLVTPGRLLELIEQQPRL